MIFPGCPLCQAAAAAILAPGVAAPAALAARRDFAVWVAFTILVVTGLAHRLSPAIKLPLWWYVFVAAVIYGRVIFLFWSVRKRIKEEKAAAIIVAALRREEI